MAFGPTHLVHTDEANLAESGTCRQETGSIEPGTRSSAGEHPLHTGRVGGSIPTASTTPGWVYFIRSSSTGLVKIGKANDVGKRLAALRCASGDQLTVLGVIEASEPLFLEGRLHAEFMGCRVRGEWFLAAPHLLSFIGEHAEPWQDVRPCRPSVGRNMRGGRKARLLAYKSARGIPVETA